MRRKLHAYSFVFTGRSGLLLLLVFLMRFTAAHAQAYTESFDNITTLTGSGWFMQNNSSPTGILSWFQGSPSSTGGPFNAYTGAANAYIAANFNSTAGGTGVISNWLITPNRTLRNGDVFTFYTRKPTISSGMTDYPDRLEVRMSTNGASTNVGSSATGVGDFTTMLLSINPTLVAGVYPQVWTQYTITISGLPAPTSGRIAFRYFVTSAGPSGSNSDYIGIDEVKYTPYVCPVVSVTTTSMPRGNAGTLYSQTLSQTGALGAPSFAVTAGAVPPGMTLASNGTLSGTPTATGTFNFTVSVSDASGCTGSKAYSLVLDCPSNPVSFPAPPAVCPGAAPFVLNTATPAGGTYSGTGVSGGNFDPAAGTQTVTYTYVDPYGCVHTSNATVTVADPNASQALPSSQSACSGSPITTIALTNPYSGATFSWTRDNTAAVTGIAASGTGDISGTLVNTTPSPVTVTFTITPTAGCTGTPFTATVVVNPAVEVIPPADIVVCGSQAVTYALPQVITHCLPAQSLTTTMSAGNNHRGNMFDIEAVNAITITSFDAHPMGNTTIAIYYKTGSYAGFEFDPAGWTLIGSAAVTAQPYGTPTPVPVPVNVTIPAGEKYAFYVTSTNIAVALNYSNGTSEGAVYSADANMKFLQGIGMEYPFSNGTGSANRPRIWNGIIHYKMASGDPVLINGLASGATFPVGTTINTYEGTDALGRSATGSFKVTVNPIPTVNAVSDQDLCNGAATTAVQFNGAVAGTVYNWTNDNPAIGLAASGSGDIASFGAVNTTGSPVTATVSVTPSYTNAGNTCTGAPVDFTITANPVPSVTSVAVPPDGTYGSGDNLGFKVNYTENMTVNTAGGVPFVPVTLNTGGTVQAVYVGGSGSSSLEFQYQVSATDQDADGITIGGSLNLNGGVIQSAHGCNSVTTLNNIAATAGVKVHNPVPQTISLNGSGPLAKTYGDADFDPGATASSGLTVIYTSSDPDVATIVDGQVHIVGAGTATITVSQTGDGDYLEATAVQQVLEVSRKSISVTAEAKSKIYGDADPMLTYTYSPALAGSDAFTGVLGRAAGENIGDHAITQGTLALNDNYTLSYTGDNLTITPKAVTVTAEPKTKVYGEADPELKYTVSPALIAGDAFTGALSRAAGESIGDHAITQGTLALSDNYTLSYTGDNLTITPKAVTVTAEPKTKVYGDADPELKYTVSPALIAGDAFTGALSRAAGENIGDHAITQGTLALNSNYTLSYTGDNLTITPKAVTVTAEQKTKVYGDADPELKYTVSPALIAGDAFTGALSRAAGENIGDHAIIQGTLALNGNYTLSYTGDNLTITPKAVTVAAESKAKVYGDADPELKYTVSPALIAGDAFTGALSRTAGEKAGNYTIVQNTLALNANYQLNYVDADLVISKAVLTATAGDKTTCPENAVTNVPVSYTGFKNGENVSSLRREPVVNIPSYNTAGNYPLTVSGGAADNYSFSYVSGQLTVLPAPSGDITQVQTAAGAVSGYQLAAPAGTGYAWSTGETAGTITARSSGDYWVTVTNQQGCRSRFTLQVKLQTISIPNTFSPNGDGINDLWTIPELRNYPNAYVTIVNRDGQVVFETRNFTSWNGRTGGRDLPAGVYFYRVRKSPGDAPVTGWLNLVR